MFPRLTEVVKNLLIINALFFLATMVLNGSQYDLQRLLSMYYVGDTGHQPGYPGDNGFFRPYQIATHMFMHGSPMHILFNMFGLAMFGPALETIWGSKRFLFYYFFAAFGAAILHQIVNYLLVSNGTPPYAIIPVLGASGAIYGILIGYAMVFPDNKLALIFPPVVLKAKYFVLILIGIDLFSGLSGINTGIAHFAHLGGALFGVLLILYWRKFGARL